jgi:hypothetical protein
LQPAGLMVLERNRQCFGNRRHNAQGLSCPLFPHVVQP